MMAVVKMKDFCRFTSDESRTSRKGCSHQSRFFGPVGGMEATHELDRASFCPDGNKTAGGKNRKATTAGRNTVAKCSPMEKSTLQRGPIPQELFSRLTNAVLGEDFRDRYDLVKQVREGAGGQPCPSHSN